jgi:hypothetical protein
MAPKKLSMILLLAMRVLKPDVPASSGHPEGEFHPVRLAL